MGERVVTAHVEALPLILVPSAKKGRHGTKAPRKTGAMRALRSTSVRGHRRKSVKAMAN
jgi:hypothetical protein